MQFSNNCLAFNESFLIYNIREYKKDELFLKGREIKELNILNIENIQSNRTLKLTIN